MSEIKAVLFDFDETLQDRQKAYYLYCQQFVNDFFAHKTNSEKEKIICDMERTVNGGYVDREWYFNNLIELWSWNDHPDISVLVNHYNSQFGKYTAVFPNAVKVIKELKNRGYIVGIITNGPKLLQNTKLDSSGLRKYMDIIVVSGELGIHKPDSGIFDYTAKQIKVPNKNCLYVGDHPVNDIQGALNAGMQALWMSYGTFKDTQLDSVKKITDISQVLEYLK